MSAWSPETASRWLATHDTWSTPLERPLLVMWWVMWLEAIHGTDTVYMYITHTHDSHCTCWCTWLSQHKTGDVLWQTLRQRDSPDACSNIDFLVEVGRREKSSAIGHVNWWKVTSDFNCYMWPRADRLRRGHATPILLYPWIPTCIKMQVRL